VTRAGRPLRRRSALGPQPLRPGEVLLLDTLGELAGLYGRADLAFVGGSLAPVGGHNLLEPIQQGCPVVFGPHTDKTGAAAALAVGTGAGTRVADAAELRERALALLRDPDAARERGAKGRAALLAHRGATARTLALLDRVLGREAAGSP
jgi:3-deoxy-D-manno-octulosonic-acid transferase